MHTVVKNHQIDNCYFDNLHYIAVTNESVNQKQKIKIINFLV